MPAVWFWGNLWLFCEATNIDIIRVICYNHRAESRGRLALRKEVCFMEMDQLILYIILAYIFLEILKTIKK